MPLAHAREADTKVSLFTGRQTRVIIILLFYRCPLEERVAKNAVRGCRPVQVGDPPVKGRLIDDA